MKKTLCLFAAAVLLFSGVAFAEQSTLIDFTLLDADCNNNEDGIPQNNAHTVVDYAGCAGATFTEDQKTLMKTSLSLPEWEIVLNSSARSVQARALSKVVAAPVRSEADVPFAGKNVMGVRIAFPTWSANANALIVPPFDIPAYQPLSSADEKGNRQEQTEEEKASGKTLFEDGYGVVKNVGTIKAIAVTTYGMKFPHGLYVHLTDTDNVARRYFMGYLGFDGWNELKWVNPQYITEVRTREIRIFPIYPRGLPFVKFTGFEITRDAAMDGGDFIGYFKDVKIIYDKAVLTSERDIVDEDLWHIVTDKEAARQNSEMQKFGNQQVERYMEKAKMATEEEFTSSLEKDQAE